MSAKGDPVAAAAIGLFVLALGAAGWYVLADDAPSADKPAGGGVVDPAAPASPSDPAVKPGPPGAAQADGWIPNSATQVRAKGQPPPATDAAKCRETPDLVDIAKGIATGFEAGLREATKVSDSEESQLGDRLEREAPRAEPFRGKWDPPGDVAKYGGYVNALVKQLQQHTSRPGLRYRVHVIRDPAFNAFAMPGGVLAVHTGLFEGKLALRNEAELMAVLGHELAHVERRHPVAAYQYAKAVLGNAADEAQLITHMLQMPIQSEYEHEADSRGLALVAAAQYDPYAAVELWQRQADEEPTRNPIDLLGALDKVLHSHPLASSRCARSLAEAGKLVAGSPFQRLYRGETNFTEHAPGPQRPH